MVSFTEDDVRLAAVALEADATIGSCKAKRFCVEDMLPVGIQQVPAAPTIIAILSAKNTSSRNIGVDVFAPVGTIMLPFDGPVVGIDNTKPKRAFSKLIQVSWLLKGIPGDGTCVWITLVAVVVTAGFVGEVNGVVGVRVVGVRVVGERILEEGVERKSDVE